MAISFIGSASGQAANGGAITLTLPGSMAVDDLILVQHGNGGAADVAMPTPTTSGYTAIGEQFANSTQDANARQWYKYHNGTDTQCVLAAIGAGTTANAGVLMVFRGVALGVQGGPFDVNDVTSQSTSSADPDPAAITWTTPGTWVVITAVTAHLLGLSQSYTMPTGYTTNAVSISGDDNVDCTAGMAYNSSPSATENPGIMDHSGTSAATNSNVCRTMALREATPYIPHLEMPRSVRT